MIVREGIVDVRLAVFMRNTDTVQQELNMNQRIWKLYMKKLSMISILALLAFSCSGIVLGDETINFDDPRLEQVVRTRISKPSGVITRDDMERFRVLFINDENIVSLNGLEYAANLNYLIAFNNEISSIEPLLELEQLAYLDLDHNRIESIAGLEHLNQLRTLYLGDNIITDISVISQMSQLETLGLRACGIGDLSVIAGLQQLEQLDIGHNQIRSLSVLGELKALETIDLADNYVSDLSPLTVLSGIRHVEVMDNAIDVNENYETMNALKSVGCKLYIVDQFEEKDLNKDGVVNSLDVDSVINHYGRYKGTEGFDNSYNVIDDGAVDVLDLVKMLK